MELSCSCGARTNPIATGTAQVNFGNVERSGTLILELDVCADRLNLSTASVSFVDLSGMMPNRSFVFTPTIILEVRCASIGECFVRITGLGRVTGETTQRLFTIIVRDRPIKLLSTLSISGFAKTFSNLEPDLTFFRCPTT